MLNNRLSAVAAILLSVTLSCVEKPQDEVTPVSEVPVVKDVDGKLVSSAEIQGLGGQIFLNVDDKDPWMVSCDSDWVSLNKEKGYGPALLTLRFEANPYSQDRTAKLSFSYLYRNTDKKLELTVVQTGTTGVRKSRPRDLMLYYCGVTSFRDYYSEDVFMDYLISDEEVPRRLFDGALLLEIWKDKEHSVSFMGEAYGRICRKSEILDLFDTWTGVVLPRLDAALERARTMSEQPFHKHKVVLMIPVLPFMNPDPEWGVIEGYNTSDWKSWDNVLSLYKWEINEMMTRFLRRNYKYLELVGLYWPVENMGMANFRLAMLADYIKSRNMEFYYIPYYNDSFESTIYSIWQSYGLDMCYLQPNYFFYENVERSRLNDACALARKYGMDLEMEFNPCSYQNWGIKRTDDYIDVFEDEGVWENNNIAYYQGGMDFSNLKRSKDRYDEWYRLYKRLSTHVADRAEQYL